MLNTFRQIGGLLNSTIVCGKSLWISANPTLRVTALISRLFNFTIASNASDWPIQKKPPP